MTEPLPAALLAELARYDTPTICNAMEVVAPERRLTGFKIVNRDKLKALSGDLLAQMIKSDELELIYLHLFSLRNLSRLIAVSENYPQLKSDQNFRDLQAQLEGTENRITVERMRYNEAAQAFDTARASFPTSIVAGMFSARFVERPHFTAKAGSEVAPEVKF